MASIFLDEQRSFRKPRATPHARALLRDEVTAERVEGWFKGYVDPPTKLAAAAQKRRALPDDDKMKTLYPTLGVFHDLSSSVRVAINQANNKAKVAALQKTGRVPEENWLKDVSPKQELLRRQWPIVDWASGMLFYVEEMEAYGGKRIEHPDGDGVLLSEIRDFLTRIHPEIVPMLPPPAQTPRGRPRGHWGDVAATLRTGVVDILQKAKYRGRESAADTICCKALSWVVQRDVTPEAMHQVLRDRDRKKLPPPEGPRPDLWQAHPGPPKGGAAKPPLPCVGCQEARKRFVLRLGVAVRLGQPVNATWRCDICGAEGPKAEA